MLNVQTFKRLNVLDELAALVDHSLLVVLEPVAGEPRYGMLELVREYTLERLREASEEAETRDRQAAYLLRLMETAGPKLGGPQHPIILEQLEAELPNIRAAYTWYEEIGDHDLALRFAGVLLPFWMERGHRGEGRALLQAALSRPGAGPPIARARALSALGRLSCTDSAHWPETVAALEESLAIFRSLGDLTGSAEALDYLQLVASGRGDLKLALALEEASLRDSRAARNPFRTAWALQNLAYLTFLHGDDARGNALLDECLMLFDQLKYPIGRAWGLSVRAYAAYRRGDGPQTVAILMESVTLLRESGQTSHLASGLHQLGWALLHQGDFVRAADMLQESLTVTRAVGESEDVPAVLCALGAAAIMGGDHAAARAYFRQSRTLSHEEGNTWDSATALLGEGHVALAKDDAGVASRCYAEALQLFASLPGWDDRRRRTGMAACLAGLAGAPASTAPDRAARLFGSAAALRATVEPATLAQFDMIYPLVDNRPANDLTLVTARATLGDAVFDAAWAEGQQMTLDQALAEALNR